MLIGPHTSVCTKSSNPCALFPFEEKGLLVILHSKRINRLVKGGLLPSFEVEPISVCNSYLEGKNDQGILLIGAGDWLDLAYTDCGAMNFMIREEYLYFDIFIWWLLSIWIYLLDAL